MGMNTIVGWLLGGFATRIYAGAGAVWMAIEAVKPIAGVARAIADVMP